MGEDTKFLLGLLGVAFLLLVMAVVVIVSVFGFLEYLKCRSLESIPTNFDFHWSLFSGCRVKIDTGFWLLVDDYKYLHGDFNLRELK